MAGRIRIRLKAYDHRVIDQSALEIVKLSSAQVLAWLGPYHFHSHWAFHGDSLTARG